MRQEFLSLPSKPNEGMGWLRDKYTSLRRRVEQPLELPEPNFRLDLASRANDENRMFKHIHQSCLMHATAFVRSNQIKLAYLIDAYVAMEEARNPSGTYAIARSLLELNAFLYEVKTRLSELINGDERNWRARGESFFGTIVRARFGTSDNSLAEKLLAAGIAKGSLKPMNVMNCISTLSAEDGFADIRPRYDRLCDFVHHNLSSQTVSSEGTFIGNVARSGGGGQLRTPRGPITRYRYPAEGKAHKAVDDTISGVILDQVAAVLWLNDTPDSPYRSDEIVRWTGTPFGITQVSPDRSPPDTGQSRPLRRNEPCPCGSGKKYKQCCMRNG